MRHNSLGFLLSFHEEWMKAFRRRRGRRPRRYLNTEQRCAFCLKRLPRSEYVCCSECDDGYWFLIPTKNGNLYRLHHHLVK
jgi:hypothetical protein